jgi:hypothetical protein
MAVEEEEDDDGGMARGGERRQTPGLNGRKRLS